MTQMKIQASKIKCGGCVATVSKGLEELTGVTEISVDIPTNVVSVTGNDLNKVVIEKKLAELGYPAV